MNNRTKQAEAILGNMVRAVEMLEECAEFATLMPEVRVNLVYALPGARTPDDVAAIDGRITVVRGTAHAAGLPRWGASDHMARLIIEVRKYDSTINAGINFKCDSTVIKVVQEYCRKKGLTAGRIDRTAEPAEVRERDGASMPWKIGQLAATCKGIPRLFYEGEGWGKEPLYVALSTDAVEAAGIAIDIARRYKSCVV